MARGETDNQVVIRFVVTLVFLIALWVFVRWLWPPVDIVIIGGTFGFIAMCNALKDKTPLVVVQDTTPDPPPMAEVVEYLRFTTPGLNPQHLRTVAEGADQLISAWLESGIPLDHPSVVSLRFLEQECSRRAAAEQAFRDRYAPSAKLLAYMQRELDAD